MPLALAETALSLLELVSVPIYGRLTAMSSLGAANEMLDLSTERWLSTGTTTAAGTLFFFTVVGAVCFAVPFTLCFGGIDSIASASSYSDVVGAQKTRSEGNQQILSSPIKPERGKRGWCILKACRLPFALDWCNNVSRVAVLLHENSSITDDKRVHDISVAVPASVA